MTSRPKRTVKEICRYEEEYEEYPRKKSYASSREATINSKDLYDVEIVERDHQRQMVKIHYVGHSSNEVLENRSFKTRNENAFMQNTVKACGTRAAPHDRISRKGPQLPDADEETSGSEEKYGRKRRRKGKEKQANNPITTRSAKRQDAYKEFQSFFSSRAGENSVTCANKMAREKPLLHILRPEVSELVREITLDFLDLEYVKSKQAQEIDPESHQLPLEDVYVGMAATNTLSQMRGARSSDLQTYRYDCRNFMIEIIHQIQK
eukprot:gene2546-2941_t